MPSRGNSAIQRYEILATGRIFASEEEIDIPKRKVAVIADSESNFIWQRQITNSFLDDEGNANLARASRVQLRVSDDWQMAIQDTNLTATQPKAFYATDAVFQHSTSNLEEVNSKYTLVKTAKQLTLWDDNSTKRQLTQLLPQKRQDPVENPLMLRARQNCNEIVESVVGAPMLEMYPTSTGSLPVQNTYSRVHMGGLTQIAALVAELMGKSEKGQGQKFVDANNQLELDTISQEIAVAYNQGLEDVDQNKLDTILKELKINQYASADVGDAYVIGSVGATDESGRLTDLHTQTTFVPRWPYHFGGVVAKSGSDTVTLENYARGGEGLGNPASDPRWYFQMYGTGQGQSFHEANVALGGYANAVTTALHHESGTAQQRRERREQQERDTLMTRIKVGAVVVTVGLLAIAVGYLRKNNYI